MVAYGIAKARAMANRTNWNERTEITKAVITWFDENYEYDLEIENEDRMDDEEFTEWLLMWTSVSSAIRSAMCSGKCWMPTRISRTCMTISRPSMQNMRRAAHNEIFT